MHHYMILSIVIEFYCRLYVHREETNFHINILLYIVLCDYYTRRKLDSNP